MEKKYNRSRILFEKYSYEIFIYVIYICLLNENKEKE